MSELHALELKEEKMSRPSGRGPDQSGPSGTIGTTTTNEDGGLKNPCRSFDIHRPDMSELRIVLLGKNVPEARRVGNFILGRDAFETEAPPPSVEQQSERVRGRVEGRYITLIHTPHLLHPKLTQEELNQRVRECVSLSDPGPHVIVLVIQPDNFTEIDGNRVGCIFRSFSEETHKHTLVITTENLQTGTREDPAEQNFIQEITAEYSLRCLEFNSGSSRIDLVEMLEDIVKKNGGNHLIWEEYEDAPLAKLSEHRIIKHQYGVTEKSEYRTEQQEFGSRVTNLEKYFRVCPKLNLVLCGSDGAMKSSISDLILGQGEQKAQASSKCVSREGQVCGHLLTLVELPNLYNTQLSEEEVIHETLRCVSLCDPGVHAFLFIIPAGPIRAEDKREIEKIQEIFSFEVNNHIMVLITTETMCDNLQLQEATQAFTDTCRGRYHVTSPCSDRSVLLQKVELMVLGSSGSCYTTAMYLNAQMETGLKHQAEMRRHLCALKNKIQRQSQALRASSNLRIVLLGKTGAGKSATGNTILGRDVFDEDAGYESITRMCQKETAEVNGRQISVIDTPGMFNTELDYEQIKREISQCISMILPGPHVFLLVLTVEQQFSKEDRETVKIMQDIFGEESINYTIVLFTRGDELKRKPVEEYIRKPGSKIMNIIEQCGNRYHVFNNKDTRDNTQVTVLLDKIDTMVTVNGGSYYNNEMFQQVHRETQEEQERIPKERQEQIEKEKEELKIKYETEIKRMKKIIQEERQSQYDERKTIEEEFNEKEKQLRRYMEEKEEQQKHAAVKKVEDYEKLIEEKKKKYTEMEMRIEEFKKQRHDDQLRREQEDEKRREKEEIERRGREELKAELKALKKRDQSNEKRREVDEKTRSVLEEKLKLIEEKHKKELEINHHLQKDLEMKVQEEVKTREKLMLKYQHELHTMREAMEKDRQEVKINREQERKITEGEFRQKEQQLIKQMEDKDRTIGTLETEVTKLKTVKARMEPEPQSDEHVDSVNSADKLLNPDQEVPSLNIVVFGNLSAVSFGDENILLGQEQVAPEQAHLPRTRIISGRAISVINILDLHEGELYLNSVDDVTDKLVMENNIHSFIFALKLGQLTDDDKVGLEWLQRKFGESALPFVIILFTYEREEDCDTIINDLKKNSVLEELLKKCGDRYHTCSKSMNNQSEMRSLLETIDHLVSENNQHCYTAEMYHTALKCRKDIQDTRQQKSDHGSHPQDEADIQQLSQEQTGGQNSMPEDGLKYKTKEKLNMANTKELFNRLDLKEKCLQKLKISDILQISTFSLCCLDPCIEKNYAYTFLQRLVMMDYQARNITRKKTSDLDHVIEDKPKSEGLYDFISKKSAFSNRKNQEHPVHPMDVQMAVFHCSDSFLKQLIVTKLSQCLYALPLLVPDPFTREIEFPLWTFRQINKSWKTTDSSVKETTFTKPIYSVETPMVAFFRLGSMSTSKSELMNSLINEKHNTFFHRHCPGSSRNRLLMDGVVEIAWYLPSGNSTDHFPDCVAFCNLHGDAETNKEQLHILTEMSSVNVVLLADLENTTHKVVLEKLFSGPKPMICLLSEDDSGVYGDNSDKYTIGLKERNQSDVSDELNRTIKHCLSKSPHIFKLEDLCEKQMIKTDENQPECQKGKRAAMELVKFLDRKELYKLKEKHLPCQGKLWHDWCEMNKDLNRLQWDNLELQKSIKQIEMKRIREQQHDCGLSDFMKLFIGTLSSLKDNDRSYFLKWFGVFLDKWTLGDLSALHHEYNEKWTMILHMKKKHEKSDKMREEQTTLEKISEKLNAATFGLEHVFREMGQIYESSTFVQKGQNRSGLDDVSLLPKLVAEIMLSGYPLELMDGDAGHVPLIWVSAVLDELINILGDKRVFVLSVLGIQSSGKSTMLNAMFGLQFAVSAGRCTRGAFMQLVKVSEEMKAELKFDYILVVDTEGLRALELAGKSTRHHDNELATFVIGLGHMTLINIFGENPAEMQDILQIVVQAFLRMKKVRLNPSCMFVHQNVGDITAGEKTMEGRRRLQEKLDEMTKLAAKEKDSEAECFSDVITFNVQEDVQYFAQLWEGSPPMAPPNPCYSRNVQELKNSIFKKATMSHAVTLSQFKTRFSDLWNALLNENFVFSFKNTVEITVYRKLETEFGKWTWSLRKTMLDIEEKLHNTIENGELENIEEKDLCVLMEKTREEVEKSMKQYFEEDQFKDILIQWQARHECKIKELNESLIKDAKRKLNEVIQYRNTREMFENKKKEHNEKLFNLSKELALSLQERDEKDLKQKFDKMWNKWITELTQDRPSEKEINFWNDAIPFISNSNDEALVFNRLSRPNFKNLDELGNYSQYIIMKKHKEICDEDQHTKESNLNKTEAKDKNRKLQTGQSNLRKLTKYFGNRNQQENELHTEDHMQVRNLILSIIQETEQIINQMKIAKFGYKDSYIQELTNCVQKRVTQHQAENQRYTLTNEFTMDLCIHVCDLAHDIFVKLHKEFRDSNDPRVYLMKQKLQYYSVFKNYWNGATATAVFGKLLCSNLKSSILQAVYSKTAIDLTTYIRSNMLVFNGNRSNLEKHILESLAVEENFEKYVQYIHNPQKHFKEFIIEKVNQYITQNDTVVLNFFKINLKDKEECVIHAVHTATEDMKKTSGDAHMWLKSFSKSLADQLNLKEIICVDHKEITDFEFLQKVIVDDLKDVMSKHRKSITNVKDIKMENVRNKPDDILIEHFCRCCWVQCPFFKAICTNTMEDHDGDHSVPFHRSDGINGWYYRGTTNLCNGFCTTVVQSEKQFHPNESDWLVPYKNYRTAGEKFSVWSITPDNSELPYWKWFMCRFQKDLEDYYKKTFEGSGQIPDEWRRYSKEDAILSLDKYI